MSKIILQLKIVLMDILMKFIFIILVLGVISPFIYRYLIKTDFLQVVLLVIRKLNKIIKWPIKTYLEIKSIGIIDWIWFVIKLKRNEFSPQLNLIKFFHNTEFNEKEFEKIYMLRNKAHRIDMEFVEIESKLKWRI